MVSGPQDRSNEAAPQFDVEVALAWLRTLFGHCDAGWASLVSIPPRESGRKIDTAWAHVVGLDSLATFIVAKAPVDNIYTSMATRKERLDGGKRGGREDCLQITSLWVDLDDATGFHSAGKHSLPLPPDRGASRLLLDDFGLQPSGVLDSGGGLQAYYLLDAPIDVDDAAIGLLDRFGGTWTGLANARGWHLDNVFDVPRIMRLPGTLNHKGVAFGHLPVLVTVEELDPDRCYPADEVRANTTEALRANTTGALPATTPVGRAVATSTAAGPRFRRGVAIDASSESSAPTGADDPGRPGARFNEAWTAGQVLKWFDWTLAGADSNGDQHWHRPGSANSSGATVYSNDGHTTIWSDSVGEDVPTRRPLDPFGLLTALKYGDLTQESFALAAQMILDLDLAPELADDDRDLRDDDVGNAERLVEGHGHRFRYVGAWGRWLVWNGTCWRYDDLGQIIKAAKEVTYSIEDEGMDEKEQFVLRGWSKRSRSRRAIEAMERLARPELAIAPDGLDADPWVLNVVNGTVDLRTGELHPHDPDRLITKLAPVVYDRTATAPTWLRFLERILPDPEVREFVTRALGYGLTGQVTEHKMFVAHGTGANGKTTLAEVVLAIMGDYSQQGEPDLLLARGEAHPTGIARLHGARMVFASENDENRRLAEGTVKRLTGGDKITARYMHKNFFEFPPTHKLFLSTNHRPGVRGTDDGIWRRLRLIPFDVTIPDDERDKQLLSKLVAESSGILNWLVDGCLRWQEDGLTEPLAVTMATAGYRAEMDVLADFIGDMCEVGDTCITSAEDLYRAYGAWCMRSGEEVLSQRQLGLRLRDRRFERVRSGSGRRWHWQGLAVCGPRELANP